MKRALTCLIFSMLLGTPAWADSVDDITDALFESGVVPLQVKPELRRCGTDRDCGAMLVLCHWRPVNQASKDYVKGVAKVYQPACVWPTPSEDPPSLRCESGLCVIIQDGKYY